MTQVAGKAWYGVIVIAAILVWLAPAQADDKSLLDALRQKGLLTQQEYERLKGAELTPAQRAGLIDVLHDKGVLTKDEAAKLKSAAPEAPAAPAAAVAAPAEKPAITSPQVGYDEGFFLRTQDGNFVLKFNGRVSEDFVFSEPHTSQPSDTQTLDRARLGVDATFYKYFRMRLENEFSNGALIGGGSGLRDAFIAVAPVPEYTLMVGQYPTPLAYESIVSKKYINFVERAAVVASTFSSRRDIGVMLYGMAANRLVQYQIGAINGSGQNKADNNSDKDLVAHLVVAPFVNAGPGHLRGFSFGSGIDWGHQPMETLDKAGLPATRSSIQGQTETSFVFFPQVTRHGDRLRWTSHAAWLDGPFSVVSEFIQTEEARDGLGYKASDLPQLYTDGAYVDGTWLITGEPKPYNARIRPKRPLWDLKNPGYGAWEAALRYEYFKLRHGAGLLADGKTNDPEIDNRYDAIVAGINWYPNEFLRFSLNYLYGNFAHRGKATSTTPGSPNPDKHSNNAVLGRAQIEF